MGRNMKKSPLAPENFPVMAVVEGLEIATASTGIKYKNRDDLMIIKMIEGTSVAGFLTQSSTCSAPVEWCRKNLQSGDAIALIVNAGNANAFTGAMGEMAVNECVNALADILSCRPSRVFVASTGVIGELLPHKLITAAIPEAIDSLSTSSPSSWEIAASSILTTDTFPKGASAKAFIGETEVSISGIAKGSGMIAPNMATMLAFVFTDAKIPGNVLREIAEPILERTFNSITVDSDTSTSDTFLLFATGAKRECPEVSKWEDPVLSDFMKKLEQVAHELALQIVRDGEGATKLISINVSGAVNHSSAKKIGFTIANSPLFKTAVSGEDANWGRIVMAIGKSEEPINREKICISIGNIKVAQNGMAIADFNETDVSKQMKSDNIDVMVDVGMGSGEAKIWTCDLSHGYISINADYRS